MEVLLLFWSKTQITHQNPVACIYTTKAQTHDSFQTNTHWDMDSTHMRHGVEPKQHVLGHGHIGSLHTAHEAGQINAAQWAGRAWPLPSISPPRCVERKHRALQDSTLSPAATYCVFFSLNGPKACVPFALHPSDEGKRLFCLFHVVQIVTNQLKLNAFFQDIPGQGVTKVSPSLWS